MKKAEALTKWRRMEKPVNPMSVMRPIPYKTDGRKYGCDGVRIDGSPEFIDAVLSNLTDMIVGENNITRLELSRRPANTEFKSNANSRPDAEVCYIRLHMRSTYGSRASAFFDRDLHDASVRYAGIYTGESCDG